MTFSSGGFGSPAHLAGELFKLQTGVRATHVPYQALARAIADLLNGTNHYQFISPLPVLDLIATGKLRALAVTAPTRMAALKDVPTVGEAGYPDLIIQDWFGFLVKSGTPKELVLRLNDRSAIVRDTDGAGKGRLDQGLAEQVQGEGQADRLTAQLNHERPQGPFGDGGRHLRPGGGRLHR